MTHTSITVRFPLNDRPGESLLVWTTTPWTLTSNTAAAVHPDLTYLKIRSGSEILYIVEGREKEVIQGEFSVEGKLSGREMLGWTYRGPYDELPAQANVRHFVIAWEEISATDGTGIVHIAPGCGQEDHELGKINHLSVIARWMNSAIIWKVLPG
jgi:isoleucyl-tRNA synthetase